MADRKDPYRVYNFWVEIDGINRAGFRECSGLDTSQDPIEYREGAAGAGKASPLTAKKLPGLVKYSNITLKWGITDDAELWDWRKKVMDASIERRNGSIVLMNDSGDEVSRWKFVEGWPSKWTGPSFNATGNEVAIETLEIVHEGLEKT